MLSHEGKTLVYAQGLVFARDAMGRGENEVDAEIRISAGMGCPLVCG